jgi:hypothetical protein
VQLAAIRFYLHFALWECKRFWENDALGITNYKTLLDRVELHRDKHGEISIDGSRLVSVGGYRSVCLVTFDYDTMLEDALNETFGILIRDVPDYIASESYRLIKIHGSVDWAREVHSPPIPDLANRNAWQVAHELIHHAAELNISDTYRVVTQHPIGKLEEPLTAIFPAIAIPVETKRAFECPQAHLDALRAMIPQIRRLLIVGWRGTELHFVNLLRELCRGEIPGMVVAGDERAAEEVAVRLQQLPVVWSVSRRGFTDFVTGGEVDAFLQG